MALLDKKEGSGFGKINGRLGLLKAGQAQGVG